MKRDFLVTSEIAISKDGMEHDLHNDFDFESVEVDAANQSVSLHWRAREIGCSSGMTLSILFRKVEVLFMKGIDDALPREDDKRLAFCGFLHPEDMSVMDGYLPESNSTEMFHMILCFEGGMVLKIQAAEAEFRRRQA